MGKRKTKIRKGFGQFLRRFLHKRRVKRAAYWKRERFSASCLYYSGKFLAFLFAAGYYCLGWAVIVYRPAFGKRLAKLPHFFR